jgi:probable addiction module antidote protein/putative addiction module killer protein
MPSRIVGRIRRIEMGNPGDTRSVGQGILEMRIDYGPGYRIYYVHRGPQIVILLCGGDKRTQQRDIKRAQRLAETFATTKTARFDVADYLDTEERQVAYIAAALESGDADFVRDALGLVARARGMGGIAKKAGLNRESLYKALGETGNPEFGTVMRIVRALGLTLSARPATSGQTLKRRRVA